MNILIIGSGAREHAIAKALERSLHKPNIFCCGTTHNPGIDVLAQAYWVVDICDVNGVCEQAQKWQIDIAIIGPEAPLEKGLSDALWKVNIPVIGPKQQLARIETSKAFARDLMQKYKIAGLPKYKAFSSLEGIAEFLFELGDLNFVIKANGLMGGKGVKVAGEHVHSIDEALRYCQEIFVQNQTLVIEEKLIGQEFSFMCFSDGNTLTPMPLIQDHKRAYVGDKGPNTGGMGSYSFADHSLPFLTAYTVDEAFAISQSVINALMTETKEKYIGILYGGFIATASGVYVIEFNARFGDPEALNVLSILESDFVAVCASLIDGTLKENPVRFAPKATVCKYAVPNGYPDNPLRNVIIDISPVINKEYLYLAAVNSVEDILYATGSRTVAYVGISNTVDGAEGIAEAEIGRVKGPLFHREDIGTAELINARIEAMHKLYAL